MTPDNLDLSKTLYLKDPERHRFFKVPPTGHVLMFEEHSGPDVSGNNCYVMQYLVHKPDPGQMASILASNPISEAKFLKALAAVLTKQQTLLAKINDQLSNQTQG